MPRRRALTEAQLESLLALPAVEADLIRHWTLIPSDLPAVERRRGGHNQLGYALQLCAFRYSLLIPAGILLGAGCSAFGMGARGFRRILSRLTLRLSGANHVA